MSSIHTSLTYVSCTCQPRSMAFTSPLTTRNKDFMLHLHPEDFSVGSSLPNDFLEMAEDHRHRKLPIMVHRTKSYRSTTKPTWPIIESLGLYRRKIASDGTSYPSPLSCYSPNFWPCTDLLYGQVTVSFGLFQTSYTTPPNGMMRFGKESFVICKVIKLVSNHLSWPMWKKAWSEAGQPLDPVDHDLPWSTMTLSKYIWRIWPNRTPGVGISKLPHFVKNSTEMFLSTAPPMWRTHLTSSATPNDQQDITYRKLYISPLG